MARRRKGRAVHGILLLDKPAGCSSNQALQRVKRLYGAQKAGHTGSLDPLATGMLPICFGEATKLSGYLLNADKGYLSEMRLGITTDSADADGEILQQRLVPTSLTEEQFRTICKGFTGHLHQVPPMVSAIKVNGQRLYKLARQGKHVKREARPVRIDSLEVLAFDGVTARIAVRCSKGTYIRSLVSDIGESIGCGAHVVSLRRTFVEPFEGLPMVSFDEQDYAKEHGPGQAALVTGYRQVQPLGCNEDAATGSSYQHLDKLLLPIDTGLSHMALVMLNAEEQARFRQGQTSRFQYLQPAPTTVMCHSGRETGQLPGRNSDKECWQLRITTGCDRVRVYGPDRQLLGLGQLTGSDNSVSPARVLQYD